ncbi:photosynthetic complex assembly protein [Rhodobacterales bacterium HKCCE4037]|nr:photosynthetic complex assembly protein [Rhodobacterales bacterium HKCCE4037]
MSLADQMKFRDREMVPRALVRAMFGLMALSIALVAYAQISDHPNTGVLIEAPVVESRSVTLSPRGLGTYDIFEGGTLIASSDDDLGGFYGVIGRVLERRRIVHGADPALPVDVVRRENGHIAILDPHTEFTIELIGYGADNIAAFARLLD